MPCPPLIKRCYAIIITIEKGGKNMPRKHFELNSDVNKLIEKYDEINNVDFGIVERARQKLDLAKRVGSVKVTLANGSILFEILPC